MSFKAQRASGAHGEGRDKGDGRVGPVVPTAGASSQNGPGAAGGTRQRQRDTKQAPGPSQEAGYVDIQEQALDRHRKCFGKA